MGKGLSKKAMQGNVYGALSLTGGGEEVPGVMPRAGHGELKRLRERRLEFAMKDPSILGYMNNRTLHRLLLEAFQRIEQLQGKA